MSEIILVKKPITKVELKQIAEQRFGDFAKAVVDIEKKIIAVGGGMHADEEAYLLEKDSLQKNLWGINIYQDLPLPEMVEFDSMINLRPSQNNRSRGVEDAQIKRKIIEIVKTLVI